MIINKIEIRNNTLVIASFDSQNDILKNDTYCISKIIFEIMQFYTDNPIYSNSLIKKMNYENILCEFKNFVDDQESDKFNIFYEIIYETNKITLVLKSYETEKNERIFINLSLQQFLLKSISINIFDLSDSTC